MTSITVAVVSWNSERHLEKCLETVKREAEEHPGLELDVVVVDNASSDGSVAMVRRKFPETAQIENLKNVGFAEANNQAFRKSRSKYVMMLNPDTELQVGAIACLVDFMEEHSEAGAAGSMLISSDGEIQQAASPSISPGRELWRLLHLDTIYPLAVYPLKKWDHSIPHKVGAVQGASMIIQRAALEHVGWLDPSFFMYSEEVDLCYRLRREGWQVYWLPTSKVIHHGGQSTKIVAGQMFLELYRSKIIFIRKHYGWLSVVAYKLILAVTSLPRIGYGVVQNLLPSDGDRSHTLASRYLQLLVDLPRL